MQPPTYIFFILRRPIHNYYLINFIVLYFMMDVHFMVLKNKLIFEKNWFFCNIYNILTIGLTLHPISYVANKATAKAFNIVILITLSSNLFVNRVTSIRF